MYIMICIINSEVHTLMHLVLFRFSSNKLISNHDLTLFTIMFALEYSLSDDLSDNNITVSSAKQIVLAFSAKSNKLLINIIVIVINYNDRLDWYFSHYHRFNRFDLGFLQYKFV